MKILQIIKIMAKFLLISLLVLGLGIYSGCGSDGTGTGGAGGAAGPPEGATAANPSEGFYVKISNPPVSNPDGTSWTNAFGDLQSAIDAAAAHDTRKTVYVAQGTYKPQGHPNGGSTDREKHFALKNGVTVIGGYPGLKDNEYNDVDPSKTILSGEGVTTADTDNVYHVFYHLSALTSSAKLSNVTISGGNADDGTSPHNNGGGMYNNNSSPELTKVTFTSNKANSGGGMSNGNSSPSLEDVNFTSNTASSLGGGMYNQGSSPTLKNVTFEGNQANNGGGMRNYNSSPKLNDVNFTSNIASRYGGGMYNTGSNPEFLSVCTFTGNTTTGADGKGGAIYDSRDVTIIKPEYAKDRGGNTITPTTDAAASKTNGYYKE